MSTPTTATATLPHYAAGYPFAHQSSYRSTLPNGSSRLAPSTVSSPSSASYPYSPASATVTATATATATTTTANNANNANNVHPVASPINSGPVSVSGHSSRAAYPQPPHSQGGGQNGPNGESRQYRQTRRSQHHQQQQDAVASAMVNESQPPRKRRRSGPPDWDTFYKNGLPQEVIVIEDTPEQDDVTQHQAQHGHNGNDTSTTTVYSSYTQQQVDDRHLTKKRRRHDEQPTANVVRYDPVYNHPHSSGSTISSERTANSHSHSNSSLYAHPGTLSSTAASNTLATSINSQYDYDVTVAGQKRKRNTRQQAANESKKRDREVAAVLGPAFAHYRPPPLPPVKASEVDVKVIHDPNYNRVVNVDDEDGHYIVVPDADLTDRYQMIKLLGQGTFGKVVQARDRRKNELVAIKIIRSVQKYRDASRIELRVLETLKANDRENRNRCIHLRECFDFRNHICIVMDLLGQSVFDFLKGNGFVPFPNSQIQSFARQLFTSVAFLHDLQLIHTDLKPENILLVDANYQTFTYNRKIPSSSTTVSRQASQRKVLLDTEIRLIDFGSATFQDEYHSSVVSTRHYRAPEIILGLGWSFPCDIWSIGCILVEFFTGDALFQTHDNLEHLAMMEAVCESRIDTHLVQQAVKSTRHGGNPAAKYFKRSRLDYPSSDTTRASRRFVRAMKKLSDIIPSNNAFLKQFLDLLKRIFVYDPSRRITAKEALQHPWFREVALQDDGTEAAKIRQERARRASREHAATRAATLRA